MGGSWMSNYTPDPPPYRPDPKKVSSSRLNVPTGLDWQRVPCMGRGAGCDGETCATCKGRMVGWAPDRDFRITCEARPAKPHPLEGRFRRDDDGKWFLGPLKVDHIVGPSTPLKRIEIPAIGAPGSPSVENKPPGFGPDYYFGGP